jgi:hypothetical protein
MGQEHHIGKVLADNVAVGDNARAKYVYHADPEHTGTQAQALQQVRQLIELLAAHSDEIDIPESVLADAESIEETLQTDKPDRSRMEKLISKIAPAITGVTDIAGAIDAIHATISHL